MNKFYSLFFMISICISISSINCSHCGRLSPLSSSLNNSLVSLKITPLKPLFLLIVLRLNSKLLILSLLVLILLFITIKVHYRKLFGLLNLLNDLLFVLLEYYVYICGIVR